MKYSVNLYIVKKINIKEMTLYLLQYVDLYNNFGIFLKQTFFQN